MGVKPRLPFVPLADAYQVIGIAQIELGEDGGVREKLESGTKEGDGVLIFDGDGVKLAVIKTRPQAVVLLRTRTPPPSEPDLLAESDSPG